ncbi:alpha-amylase family glycosyl hydrolase [Chlamydiifrater phoenicopteri]|uniref:alpha-amylase family glycosyl hydrolase n=1 Tax=Chlamydiifrater phoenicopteri TaxID=2681469 RepID=UPI001BCCEEB3|nr:alpha-amylase family glycosyl hydrolase [Chlamydiifrater phoenicopteri]
MNTFFYDTQNPPLGCKKIRHGYFSFCIPSEKASEAYLVLADPEGRVLKEVPLKLLKASEKLWHIDLDAVPEDCLYGFRITTNQNPSQERPSYIADPFSTTLVTPTSFTEPPKSFHYIFSHLPKEELFNWDQDSPPKIPGNKTIIYEVHVRSFTNDPSSKTSSLGTFSGFVDKLPYLVDLGVTTVELLPIFEFNEREHPLCNPSTNKLCNYWGYAPINFFCPSRRYSKNSLSPALEFKSFVKEAHKVGIEVILDVVFNHTGSESLSPFSTLDKDSYYIMDSSGQHTNYSGCGNTFNSNSNQSIKFILKSLRYWVEEFHVDGFRFDLASCLLRATSGELLEFSPVLEKISNDPVISKVKLIAEPWDAAGGYHLGFFSSFSKQWSEWNGEYRDSVRAFLNGDKNFAEKFALSFMGSPHIFKNSPFDSINFVTCHDGFSLRDLVTYKNKHNTANGENNQDGSQVNYSQNFGVEGPSIDPEIQQIRNRQIKNFILTLMLSLGTPMILSGDEYGHTGEGNNNRWCHDSSLNYFLWDEQEKSSELFCFTKKSIALRKELEEIFSLGVSREFFWTNELGMVEDFIKPNPFLAVKISTPNHRIFLAFNTSEEEISFKIPETSAGFLEFTKIVDTKDGFLENRELLKSKEQNLPPHTVACYKSSKENS